MKGRKFAEQAADGFIQTNNDEKKDEVDLFQRTAVKAVLENGCTRDEVKMADRLFRKRNGNKAS